MARAGRKPTPSHLKLIRGNPGKRAINKNEPIPEGDLKEAPEWLSKSQIDAWNCALENAPKGLLKKLDGSILAVWVVASDLHREAVERVNKLGLLTKSPVKGDPMQNPYLPIINKQAQIMMKAAAEMGFTPSSRSRIEIAETPKGESKFDNV